MLLGLCCGEVKVFVVVDDAVIVSVVLVDGGEIQRWAVMLARAKQKEGTE